MLPSSKPTSMQRILILALALATPLLGRIPNAPGNGERLVLVGSGLGERMLYFHHFETELHVRFPDADLVVRNMCRPGDTPAFRPHPARESQWAIPNGAQLRPEFDSHFGKGHYPTPDAWLEMEKADTILALFGYNESFDGPEGVGKFRAELDAFVVHTLKQKYNGKSAPRLVLASPIAFEDLSDRVDLPDGREENANLKLYSGVIEEVARKHQLAFIDLFTPSTRWYKDEEGPFSINGFALNDAGYRKLAPMLASGLYGSAETPAEARRQQIHEIVEDKDWFWFNDYQVLNGVHVYGQRWKPYGNVNYPEEIDKVRQLTQVRDRAIHQAARGKSLDLAKADEETRPLTPIETNYTKPIQYNPGEELGAFDIQEGFKVELFASEAQFPDLANPVQMSFDNKGRLWVSVLPSYPHYKPGDMRPDDKILILEDRDNDGKADHQITFADGLHLPIGFEITPEGVYVSEEPNLCLLVDDDGDDRADRKEILLHGFDSHDTHHAISAYCADPSGAIYLSEGRFLHSQVETPYGPERCNDGGVWRFDPKSWRLERYSQSDYSNPWGFAVDQWGQGFISDASSGRNWWSLPVSAKVPYGYEIGKIEEFAPKRARPTSGSEFVSSRHFPDEIQGAFLLNNSIGLLGTTLWDIMDDPEDPTGITGKVRYDLLVSADPNYRPVDLEFAPDGSLYIVDWQNALVGHMQHSARDPNRDHAHGRIYRVTCPSRPLVDPPKIAGASIATLLENLKLHEDRARYRTRRELRGRNAEEVLAAARKWAASLDKSDPLYERHLLEALWVGWGHNQVDPELLAQCLAAKKPEVRAAAVHVLRYAHRRISNSADLFLEAARDPHGRVRLEAAVAASWLDNADGARIALEASRQPVTKWMEAVFPAIFLTLADDIKALGTDLSKYPQAQKLIAAKGEAPDIERPKRAKAPSHVEKEFKAAYEIGAGIYSRDGFCITCHQADGKGSPEAPYIYPPLNGVEWVTGDKERLIKLTLHGLMGPMEVKGRKYDGAVPMTPIGLMIKDHELAAVLTYVRNSFGNKASGVTQAEVNAVREATKDRVGRLYSPEELLKEHPMK